MEYAAIILKLIELAGELTARAKAEGSLTDQQAADLLLAAVAVFAKYNTPAPPPPGVTP